MSLYETFKSAGTPLTEGVWIEYGDCRVKVRYAGRENKQYARVLRALTAPYARLLENENANLDEKTQKKLDSIFAEIYAKSIVVDWEGVNDPDGNEMAYSWENAKKLLVDLPLFFEEIKKVSGTMQTFRQEQLEDEAKNSPAS